MRGKCILAGLVCLVLLSVTGRADAMILIHEFLADPPSGIAGDANGDGTRSSSADEFVELFNSSESAVDLGGWSIHDASSPRHVFAEGTFFAPGELLVVFGGGNPVLPGINWQTASSGGFGLNNSGDTITLYNREGGVEDSVTFGSEGGQNQSLVRSPEAGEGAFVLHSQLKEGAVFSPGTFAVYEPPVNDDSASPPGEEEFLEIPSVPNEDDPVSGAPVPEPLTLLSFGAGMAGISFIRKRR